ncbi:MazG family protein [Saccharopolyspora sp. HNM0983]|uniref:MazG family protein n=1 Tax=Saccharopolyspora montiporae TaxID=2781240 RepID=A0A929BA13_9PSEU|nr:MazG family protein [Saccharopolyspora sp. HNM0983]MBE9373893.1 MazG family protein [Saccharopolyspora sp. HNM0983]
MDELAAGSAVVLVDHRLGAVLPAAAAPLLRAAQQVWADPELDGATRVALGAVPAPPAADLVRQAGSGPVLLFAARADAAAAEVLRAAGAQLIGGTSPAGGELLAAVRVMDRLRSPGGCPWDAEQDHDSLRRYLVEETYELLDAIERRDRAELREELGDVLLQVLFHARVAAEDPADPFDVDEVAAGLVGKLVARHPHVFAEDTAVSDAESQGMRWEELKQREKQRESAVDGVALGQPAVALAAKLVQRASRAGVPADALPSGGGTGEQLFDLAARAALAGDDPEDRLRAVATGFADRVRAAERRARESGADPADLPAAEWRRLLSASPAPARARGEA